jgi:hypothetical protein
MVGPLVVLVALGATGCSDDDENAAPIQQGTTIHLADGTVQGEFDGATRRFLGIPFAAPPVGDLRWRPPQPPGAWQGVRAANAFGSPCPQIPSINGTPSQEEDCLYLRRPLYGIANLAVGIGGTLAGIAWLPVDHGATLRAGLNGALFSVPELAFINIRKGSFAFAPRHWMGNDGARSSESQSMPPNSGEHPEQIAADR